MDRAEKYRGEKIRTKVVKMPLKGRKDQMGAISEGIDYDNGNKDKCWETFVVMCRFENGESR
jgi:hypothetical protein